jgi:hypothetical protein
MNILELFKSSSKNSNTEPGKASKNSASSYIKALFQSKNKGKLVNTAGRETPYSLPHNDLPKFQSKYDLPKPPVKYTDSIK